MNSIGSFTRIPGLQAFLVLLSLTLWSASSFLGHQFRIHEPLRLRLESLEGVSVASSVDNEAAAAPIVEDPIKDTRTLYEILGAPATANRTELKKCYVALAKLSHPDAQISRMDPQQQSMEAMANSKLDFNEIAQAWRILGDAKLRKRYDRELRAQAFAESAQRFTNENLERAVPVVASMMDRMAAPFLRRTTATTWAVGNAVAQGRGSGWTDAFQKAVQAGQEAGRFIDSVELAEKSLELEKRAKEELKRGQQIEEDLDRLTEQRLLATIQSEDFFLSSEEANDVLNRLSIESNPTIIDRALLRNTIQQDIESLHEAESKFSEKMTEYEATDREWNLLLQKQDEAKITLSQRQLEELEARRALELAQQKVAEAKSQLLLSTNSLRGIEQRVRKSAFEMDRVTSALNQKQEKVRSALKKKVDLALGGIQVEHSLTEEDLTALRRKEIQLLGESKEVARMATRLQSRAEKLRNRAEALESLQRTNGQHHRPNGATNSTMMYGP
eukprot:scaffold992_cov116-Cylindrotheca_fusiformis.AAC.10